MSGSYSIGTEFHFNGNPSGKGVSKPKVDASLLINGSSFVAPTVSQHSDRWSYYVDGKDAVFRTASGNSYRSLLENIRFGPKTQIDDERIVEWKSAAEDIHPSLPCNDLIPTLPRHMYKEGMRVGMYMPHEGDTKANLQVNNDIVNVVPINEVGHFVHKTRSQAILFKGMMKGGDNYEEAKGFYAHLAKEGVVSDTNPIYGMGTEATRAVAGFYPSNRFITRSYNFREKVIDWLNDISGNTSHEAVHAMERSFMLHETAHGLGIGGSPKDEALQGRVMKEYYSGLAKNAKGEKARAYEAVAQVWEWYETHWNENAGRSRFKLKDDRGFFGKEILASLNARLEAEAEAMGLSGSERSGYISERMSEMYDGLSDAPRRSYRSTDAKSAAARKRDSKRNSQSQKDLDSIVGESDEASREEGKDSRSYRADSVKSARNYRASGNSERRYNSKYNAKSRKSKERNSKDKKSAEKSEKKSR